MKDRKGNDITCDTCGGTEGVGFFGNTSVTVCNKPECNASQNNSWEDHCAEMDAMFKYEEEMGW